MPLFDSSTLIENNDHALEQVYDFFIKKNNFSSIIAKALRQSIDEVIDGPRTGRYRIEQLEKTEKTYIGTKVEIIVRNELALDRGEVLDNKILGHEVDTKFSLQGGWMIPREAIDHICLLIKGDDKSGVFSVGLLRMTIDVLTNGANQDKKKSVSSFGKKQISWILKNHPMERNFLLDLSEKTRDAILSPKSGKQRIISLFQNVNGEIIPRSAILQVAQLKGDPLRRARETKANLAKEGILVLCSAFESDRVEFLRHGFPEFKDDDWLSIRL